MDEGKPKEVSCSYYMIGGEGPNSYSQNSDYQKQLLESTEDLMKELITDHVDIENHPPFKPQETFIVADFGCSDGPNTFFAVENIISAVEKKYKSNQKNPNTPEFQVFFNDLVGNDFNTLFRNLPQKRPYFAAAVPGSFHRRLFPKATIHIAHCSTSLHWLSKIPKEVTDRSSTAWNKGKIHYSGAAKEVREAYSAQYTEDMETLLSARSKELVSGGLMMLVILGYPDSVLTSGSGIGITFEILEFCLKDMSKIGKITEERVDSFNLPFYYPWPSELKALIETNGLFGIERIARLPSPMSHKPDPRVLSSHLRAVVGGLIEGHFGNAIVDELFKRHLEKLTESPITVTEVYQKEANYFIFLKKKKCHDLSERSII